MPIDLIAMAAVPTYNSPLIAVADGFFYIGQIYDQIVLANNQDDTDTATAFLRPDVEVSSCFLNLAIYAVDGTHIAELDLRSNTALNYYRLFTPQTISDTPPASLSETAGGTLPATTYFVQIAYVQNTGQVTPSTETSLAVDPNNLLVVASPADPGDASIIGYLVYASDASGSETLQTLLPIAIGTDWTESTTGLTVTGSAVPIGFAPTNCSITCNWRGRFVLAGDSQNPQNFYMARQGVPTDWDYGATDAAAAVAGNLSESGRIGEPIMALMPYTDDVCLIGCANSLWMIQGDPADGGTIVRVSDQMGVIGPNAWTVDPQGMLYFIARGGLYSVKPLWEFYQPPQLLTGETYDQYFNTLLQPPLKYLTMVWDIDLKYMHIFATPIDDGTVGTHLLYDPRNGGLWPQVYPLDLGPTATCRYAANVVGGGHLVMMGGWDGYIRQWTPTNLTDDGFTIEAYVVLGPVQPDPEASVISALTIVFGEVLAVDNQAAPILVQGEVPSGPINGTNDFFLLAQTPIDDTIQVFLNDIRLVAGVDYTLSFNDLTLTVPPPTGATLTADYQYLGTPPTPWNVDVKINAGPDAFSVTEGTPHSQAIIPVTLDRRTKTFRQRFRGGWFSFTIGNENPSTYFSFESGLLEFSPAGRNRERR